MDTKLEGIHYVRKGKLGTNLLRGRRKITNNELQATRVACHNARAESNRIRAWKGLDPLPYNFYELALMEALDERTHEAKD